MAGASEVHRGLEIRVVKGSLLQQNGCWLHRVVLLTCGLYTASERGHLNVF